MKEALFYAYFEANADAKMPRASYHKTPNRPKGIVESKHAHRISSANSLFHIKY